MSRLTNTVYAASASAERIIEFLDHQPTVHDREAARTLDRVHGVVEFDAVSFGYPTTTKPALADISFEVGPGEQLALVGASGAGKSTLVKLLVRFYDPDAGGIRIDGTDLRAVTVRSLRENVAVLWQETLMFDGTVRENIAYGRSNASDEEIIHAAVTADAHDFIVGLPQGYETPVGQRGRALSGGQRQRVAIARAMIRDAPVLVLDEPTTGLDAESGRRILAPLQRLMAGRTTIVVSHNLLTVRDASQIVVLDHGRIVERGRHDELLAREGQYARLYELQAAPASNGHRDTQHVGIG